MFTTAPPGVPQGAPEKGASQKSVAEEGVPEAAELVRQYPIAVLIPAYRPNRTLTDVVAALVYRGIANVVVIDDGSGPPYRALFDDLAQIPGVHVLRHAINLGKGSALKTAFNYVLTSQPDAIGVITADADGQHDPDDIVRICQRFTTSPEALILGARTFSGDVPLRSRFGNSLTRRVMQLVLGQKLADTQTGLRAIPLAMLPRLMKVPATGYEFELEMLIAAKHQAVRVIEQPIRTIYEPGNPASHFHPLRDSMRIYFVLLRFSMISLVTAVIDNLTFYFAYRATGTIAGAQIAGRTAALLFNYRSVRKAVFFSDQPHRVLVPRYLLLVGVNALASYAGIRLLTSYTPLGVFPSKILTESVLFIANFTIQRDFIFTRRAPSARSAGF
jgi:glycosyltransferase involved in cell wall biosynthesis